MPLLPRGIGGARPGFPLLLQAGARRHLSGERAFANGSVHLKRVLSPFELEVAELARAGYGRNGIAAVLGISPGTVKVVLRQIRWKLGEDWRVNPHLVWPNQGEDALATAEGALATAQTTGMEEAAIPAAAVAVAADPEPDGAMDRWQQEAREGRRLAALMLVQSTPTRTLLKVSGLQRFFLKPLLSALEGEGHLRLLAADRNEVFAPPWLPIVNRGRRAVRAASYLVRNEARVRSGLQEYFSVGLTTYVQALLERLRTARSLAGSWRRVDLPDAEEMWSLVRKGFNLTGER